ncbi:MAG: glutathione peroxidase [Rhizomicrobium sp.]|nr:glutathione peroxidase [Rhizomicrobium sp.]
MTTLYDFSAPTLSGDEIRLKDFAGQVVVVVNTASKCGFTPQYAGLESLYQTYKSRGLVVLGFPCNQFGAQEPGSADDIAAFCAINYGVTFPVFAKVDVNGAQAHPLFSYLTKALPGWMGRRVRWNFTKFLIARDGTPLRRFAPTTEPQRLALHIDEALRL